MNKNAVKRRRFGYRRIVVLLECVGMIVNEKSPGTWKQDQLLQQQTPSSGVTPENAR